MNDQGTSGPPPEASAAQDARTEPSDIEALRGVEAALTSLADDCKKAAERHLVRAAVGLIIGFVTALLLPVAFTLIDAFVDRQLADWKAQGAAAQAPNSEKITADFAVVRDELSKYKNDKRELLRRAYDTRFGTVLFRSAPPVGEGKSELTRSRSQRTIQCGAFGAVETSAAGPDGRYAGVVGIGWDSRSYREKPALVTLAGDNCILTPLEVPTIPVREGFRLEADERSIGFLADGEGVAIPVVSNAPDSDDASSRFLEGVVACQLTEGADKEGVFPCVFARAPETIRVSRFYEVRMNALDKFGLIVDLESSEPKLLYAKFEESLSPEEAVNQDALPRVRLIAKDLDFPDRIDRIFVKDDEASLVGTTYGGPANVMKLSAANGETLEPTITDAGSITVSSQYSIRDVAIWKDRAIALLSASQEQLPVLALADANRAVPLFATAEPRDVAPIIGLHVVQDTGKGTQLVLQRSDAQSYPPSSTQQSVASSYSAAIEKVIDLFAGTDPQAELPTDLEDRVFASAQTWDGADVLIPDADRTTVKRAQAIKSVLAAFTTAATSFDDIQKNLQASHVQLAEAQQKVKDTESDIAFWSTIAARIVVIALIFYFVQLEMSLNRYNSRLSGHYRARALAMGYLLGSGQAEKGMNFENLLAAIMAIDSKEISSKDPPGPPTDKLLGALQGLVKSRGSPAG